MKRVVGDEEVVPHWQTRGFARCVALVHAQLAPIPTRSALADSYRREAVRHDALEAAYALRWMELG